MNKLPIYKIHCYACGRRISRPSHIEEAIEYHTPPAPDGVFFLDSRCAGKFHRDQKYMDSDTFTRVYSTGKTYAPIIWHQLRAGKALIY